MTTTIQKWGNSIAVRLPSEVARKSGVHVGVCVQVEAEGKQIVITPVPTRVSAPTLDTLVRGVHKNNLHTERSWSAPRGKEVW